MLDISQIIATCIAATVTGIGASYLTFRLASAYTNGRDEQWRRDVERRMSMLEEATSEGAELRASNAVRLEGMSQQMDYLLRTVGVDGKHGLRGDLHSLREDWSPILVRLQTLMERDQRSPRMRTRRDD